jgi:hypothetical protein
MEWFVLSRFLEKAIPDRRPPTRPLKNISIDTLSRAFAGSGQQVL